MNIFTPDDDYDFEDFGDDELDEYEMALGECGQDGEGFCMLIGTEYCDWDCPFSNELAGSQWVVRPEWEEDPDDED